MSDGRAAVGANSAELATRYIVGHCFNAKTSEEISKLPEIDRKSISLPVTRWQLGLLATVLFSFLNCH